MSVPDWILRKPGPLDDAEAAKLRRHPSEGVRLIGSIERFRPALPYVLFHHERWDGCGYPTGRAGRAIPVEARILALADAFDAMISTRPYRPALPVEYALGEVERGAGTQFDPELASSSSRPGPVAVVPTDRSCHRRSALGTVERAGGARRSGPMLGPPTSTPRVRA